MYQVWQCKRLNPAAERKAQGALLAGHGCPCRAVLTNSGLFLHSRLLNSMATYGLVNSLPHFSGTAPKDL